MVIPVQYNVAQLLKDPVGSRREYPIEGAVARIDEQDTPIPVTGTVDLVRTNDGILVHVRAALSTTEECSRCLAMFSFPMSLEFDEEYFPTVDVNTGMPLPGPREPDDFTIDHNHMLDLGPAIREYAVVARPMKPLHSEECQGICAQCGADLNLGTCKCAPALIDTRWAALRRLVEQE